MGCNPNWTPTGRRILAAGKRILPHPREAIDGAEVIRWIGRALGRALGGRLQQRSSLKPTSGDQGPGPPTSTVGLRPIPKNPLDWISFVYELGQNGRQIQNA